MLHTREHAAPSVAARPAGMQCITQLMAHAVRPVAWCQLWLTLVVKGLACASMCCTLMHPPEFS